MKARASPASTASKEQHEEAKADEARVQGNLNIGVHNIDDALALDHLLHFRCLEIINRAKNRVALNHDPGIFQKLCPVVRRFRVFFTAHIGQQIDDPVTDGRQDQKKNDCRSHYRELQETANRIGAGQKENNKDDSSSQPGAA